MSEPASPAPGEQPRVRRRRVVVGALAGALVAVVVAGIAVVAATGNSSHPSTAASRGAPDRAASPPVTASASAGNPGQAARDRAIRSLLHRRAQAILHGNRKQLLATIDPDRHGFRRTQLRLLTDVAPVPLASWSYRLVDGATPRPTARSRRYNLPTFTPTAIELRYRIRGFDRRPTDLVQYPTFTERDGRWYLASLSDFVSRGKVSATDVWDYGPVSVVHAPDVLAIGAPSERSLMNQLVAEAREDIPQVSSVWGTDWPQRVVLVVPGSEREAERITGVTDLSRIAAESTAEVRRAAGAPDPVGGRVTINPEVWQQMSTDGRVIVLRHELTHVATLKDTSHTMPTWLVEGFADYVAFRYAGIRPLVVASALAPQVRAGELPRSLPTDADFDGTSPHLAQAYDEAWLACRYLAQRFGQSALVALYRSVGTSPRTGRVAVKQALAAMGLTKHRFVRGWHRYLRDELG